MSKRIHARVMVHQQVEYQHAGGQGNGMLVDLSLQGCRLTGASPGPCGTRLRLQFWLPDLSQPVKVELAAVRWVTDDQFAVSFLEVLPDARARLAQVVQVLQTAQKAEAHMIPISSFVGSEQGSPRLGVCRGFGKPTHDL